jgi:diguanylate cyclase (GGDEF)-like protein
VLIAEIIILLPFYLSFRANQFELFEKEQLYTAKLFLSIYEQNETEIEELSLLRHSDIKGLVIYNTDGSILRKFGQQLNFSPVDLEPLKPVSKDLYIKDLHHFYAFWDQKDLNAPYEIVAMINSSYLTDILYQFVKVYWDEALLLLLVMTMAVLILSYFWLLRPIRNAYSALINHTPDSPELKITQLPHNELGFIFNAINKVFVKLAKTILELRDSSETITKLNENLETKVQIRTRQLKESNQALKAMAQLPEENINPVFRADSKGKILYSNPASSNLFKFWNCSETLVLPQNWVRMIAPIMDSAKNKQIEVNIDDKVYLLEFVPISPEAYVNIYGLDITEHKRAEEENRFLQNHNQVTRLYNRRAFKLLLEEKIKQSTADFIFSLWLIQANDIMNINQNLGYAVGDEFLRKIAALLEKNKPADAFLGHFNQNIFSLAVFSEIEPDIIGGFASRILSFLEQPFCIEAHKLRTSVNIGIALYPGDAKEIDNLVKFADMALLQSVSKGPNSLHFYTEELNEKISTHHKIYQGLHDAVLHKELVLFYQPQLDLNTNSIVGVEALIRWQHPEYGLISPDDFIEVLEKSSLIFEITPWLFETAAKQLENWKKLGLTNLKLAVNLSAQQLLQKNLLLLLQNIIKNYDINPGSIAVEVTERTSLLDPDKVIAILKNIQAMKFEIALDDFGTDYSSLTYLQKLPINKLKIDKSFVDNITESKGDKSILKTIIQLAKELNLSTIAEGVETEEQKLILKKLGCDEIQGYLVSRPLSAKEVTLFLKQFK